ncbi:Aromatic amino acid aminotransferase [Lasiodiplodia theobromae]|uniref:Aromatic amino acid aminotransferase n=1 Tax=Lasiodiplodia theobromae TaxID=45133 RepID=A0A5N5DDU5_9PEZI|nr:Aromatic amino acid aminotransferase [Lasiodiplodia theobromae]
MLREKLLRLEKQRAHSEPLPSGPSPYTSSSFFKTPTATPKPKAKSWNHLFSNAALNQGTSVLKAFARSKSLSPDTISLGTGRPSAEFYPWTSLSMHTAATTSSNSNPTTSPPPQTTMTTTCSITDTSPSAYNLAAALNYGYAAGSPQLVRFVTEHVELVHDPPYADWETCLTAGTTAALDTVLELFCDRGEDTLLVEAHTYAGALDAARARGLDVLGVGMDEEGLVPEELDRRLREWDGARGGGGGKGERKKKKKKPSVLYTIPSGQNPTGATQSAARRRAIYEVAERHDLYIIEDDPYYFLQLGAAPALHQTTPPPTTNDANDTYLTSLPPSYLSLDTSGRVLRLDSASKILAPGLRAGWLTASAPVVAKFLARTELGAGAPSGPSQVLLYKLLDEAWGGHAGLIGWLRSLSVRYRRRRDVLVEACERYLPSVCEWTVPAEGMFLWVRVGGAKWPGAGRPGGCGGEEGGGGGESLSLAIEDRIFTQAQEEGVLVSKGSWFAADDEAKKAGGVNFRLTFAAAPLDALDRAVSRFGAAVRAVYQLD